MKDSTEPEFPFPEEPDYPSLNLGRLVLLNGPVLALAGLLFVGARHAEGYLGGLWEILAVWGLIGLGALLNLIAAATTTGSRVGYVLMAVLYWVLFGYLFYVFSHIGNPKIGG